MNAIAQNNATSAQQQFDGAEYVVTVLDCGAVVYTEVDTIELSFDIA